MPLRRPSRLRRFITFLFCTIIVAGFARAQEGGVLPGESLGTNPKPRSTTVTATVPDIVPPSIPILIAPTNASVHNINRLTFIWQESTDNIGVTAYHLFLDGVAFFSNIPLSSTTNSSYVLSYADGTYSLVPFTGMPDGSHTWKIQAQDARLNATDSATWSFIIDTTAPPIVITHIGSTTVSISSQDSDTIPTSAISITENNPTISGTTESNASIVVTLFLADGSTVQRTTSATSAGAFSVSFPVLERNVIHRIQIRSTDYAGNTSVLDNVPFTISSLQIVLPSPLPKITIPATVPSIFERRETMIRTIEEKIEEFKQSLPQELVVPFEVSLAVSVRSFSVLVLILLIIRYLEKFFSVLRHAGQPVRALRLREFASVFRATGIAPWYLIPFFAQQRGGMILGWRESSQEVGTIPSVQLRGMSRYVDEMRFSDEDGWFEQIHTEIHKKEVVQVTVQHKFALFSPETVAQRVHTLPEFLDARVIELESVEKKNLLPPFGIVRDENAHVKFYPIVPVVMQNDTHARVVPLHIGGKRMRWPFVLLFCIITFFEPSIANIVITSIYGWYAYCRSQRKKAIVRTVFPYAKMFQRILAEESRSPQS